MCASTFGATEWCQLSTEFVWEVLAFWSLESRVFQSYSKFPKDRHKSDSNAHFAVLPGAYVRLRLERLSQSTRAWACPGWSVQFGLCPFQDHVQFCILKETVKLRWHLLHQGSWIIASLTQRGVNRRCTCTGLEAAVHSVGVTEAKRGSVGFKTGAPCGRAAKQGVGLR